MGFALAYFTRQAHFRRTCEKWVVGKLAGMRKCYKESITSPSPVPRSRQMLPGGQEVRNCTKRSGVSGNRSVLAYFLYLLYARRAADGGPLARGGSCNNDD